MNFREARDAKSGCRCSFNLDDPFSIHVYMYIIYIYIWVHLYIYAYIYIFK